MSLSQERSANQIVLAGLCYVSRLNVKLMSTKACKGTVMAIHRHLYHSHTRSSFPQVHESLLSFRLKVKY